MSHRRGTQTPGQGPEGRPRCEAEPSGRAADIPKNAEGFHVLSSTWEPAACGKQGLRLHGPPREHRDLGGWRRESQTPGRMGSAPPHPGSGTPRPVQHADPLLLSPAGASGHRLPGCLQVRTCPGPLSEHQRPRPRVQGPHTGVSTSPEPALLQVLSEALSTALGEHLVTPGADQQASDVAPRPGTASASLGLLRLCWRQWGAPAGRPGARSGARGRPWAVAVPSPGWASPPRADLWLTCQPGAHGAAGPQTPRAAGAGQSPARVTAAVRLLGEGHPARQPTGPTPRPLAGGRGRPRSPYLPTPTA